MSDTDLSGRTPSCDYREHDLLRVLWKCILPAEHDPQAHRMVPVKEPS